MNKELEPFNLEKAKAGEPIQTRDGRPAKFIAHVPECAKAFRAIFMVVGEYTTRDCATDGRQNDIYKRDYDLFMAPKPKVKREGWVNVYNSGMLSDCHAETGCSVFHDEAAAKQAVGGSHFYLATVHIEWEEEA